MSSANDSNKTIERKKFVRKHQVKTRRDKSKAGGMNVDAKASRQNHRYRMIVEDVVVYNFPARERDSEKVKSLLKRKLPSIDEEWEDLPSPYPRKLKSHRNPVSLEMYGRSNDSNCINYGDEDTLTSDVLPTWTFSGEENSEHSSCDNTEVAGVQIVTIDELIEFEGNEFGLDKTPIRFEIRKLCAVVGTEDLLSEEDSNQGEEKKTDDETLLKNDSRLTCGSNEDFLSSSFKEADREHVDRYCSMLKCSECWKVEDCKEQWREDYQIEKFNFGRCFKCREKVYMMHNCPYHSTKGTVVA